MVFITPVGVETIPTGGSDRCFFILDIVLARRLLPTSSLSLSSLSVIIDNSIAPKLMLLVLREYCESISLMVVQDSLHSNSDIPLSLSSSRLFASCSIRLAPPTAASAESPIALVDFGIFDTFLIFVGDD